MYNKIKSIFQSKIFKSKVFKEILCGVGILVLAILIFQAGLLVGFRKASFGHAWGEGYARNFGMTRGGPLGDMPRDLPNAHGAVGKIIKIELPTIIVQDKDNTEKVILTNDTTKIVEARKDITAKDLKIDDFIVVIGSPNDQGQVEAKLIRLMPEPGNFIPDPTGFPNSQAPMPSFNNNPNHQ